MLPLLVAAIAAAIFVSLAEPAAGAGGGAGIAPVQPNIVPTQTPVPTPTPTPAPLVTRLAAVEVRPDHTVLLTWSQAQGASGYEVGVRRPGAADWTAVATRQAPLAAEFVDRVIRPSDDWAGPGEWEFATRPLRDGASAGTWSAPVTATIGATMPSITNLSANDSTVTVSWAGVGTDEPFVRYEVHLAESEHPIGNCVVADVPQRLTTSVELDLQSLDCGPVIFDATTTYTVGVRTVYEDSDIGAGTVVASRIEVASIAMPDAAHAPEQFRVGQVDGTVAIVDGDGAPAVWRGINLRRGELVSYAYNTREFDSLVENGFDTVRVTMEWDRFERDPGVFESAHFGAIDRLLGFADRAGVNVILDPIHLAGPPDWHIPQWAWDRSTNGEMNDRLILDIIRENATPYLRYVTQRYSDHPRVIAIDLINEPREPVGWPLDAVNADLIRLYHDLVADVRDLDADKPLVLEAYYGNALITGDRLSTLPNATLADPAPRPADYENLIWSIHDYYAGREGEAYDDGYTDNGYPLRGSAADGTRHRTESWTGTGCYPSGPTATECTDDTSRADVLVPSMRMHVGLQYEAAQQAGMPLFVGEYGIPHAGDAYQGWSGGREYYTDKNEVYDNFGVSRALWEWRVDVDPTFGMYSRTTRAWHEWTRYASGLEVAEPQGPVDDDPIPGADASVEVMHANSCLASNGRIDTNIVNTGTEAAVYRIEVAGLTPRQAVVDAGDWWRLPVTGRADGDHEVVVTRDGTEASRRTITVACDESPRIEDPPVRVVNACRAGNGYVLFQFVNDSADPQPLVIEFEGVVNRSTTVPPHGQAARAVTGRPDGRHGVIVRTPAGEVLLTFDVVVLCDQ